MEYYNSFEKKIVKKNILFNSPPSEERKLDKNNGACQTNNKVFNSFSFLFPAAEIKLI